MNLTVFIKLLYVRLIDKCLKENKMKACYLLLKRRYLCRKNKYPCNKYFSLHWTHIHKVTTKRTIWTDEVRSEIYIYVNTKTNFICQTNEISKFEHWHSLLLVTPWLVSNISLVFLLVSGFMRTLRIILNRIPARHGLHYKCTFN